MGRGAVSILIEYLRLLQYRHSRASGNPLPKSLFYL